MRFFSVKITFVMAAISGLMTWWFWPQLAVLTAPTQEHVPSQTQLAADANSLFWKTLHSGDYDNIDDALLPLQAAWLENPDDAVLASHIGWLNIWKLSERARNKQVMPAITDHALLARQMFAEAVARVPEEPRYQGFLATLELAVANITHNSALQRQGYFRGLDAIKAWPEFNGFTMGYVLTGNLPHDDKVFAEGLEMIWQNVEDCVGQVISRDRVDVDAVLAYLQQDISTMNAEERRACFNSWIAPYNEQGFFMVLADALVKQGNWPLAIDVYELITKTQGFGTWPYAAEVKERIANAEQNVQAFRQAPQSDGGVIRQTGTMMINSVYSCIGCHQHSPASKQHHQMPEFIAKTLR